MSHNETAPKKTPTTTQPRAEQKRMSAFFW